MINQNFWPDQDPDVLVEEVPVSKTVPSNQIILYNDDYNTFDHVIDCLVEYCKHQKEQAHQCALIVHLKGRCSIKEGEMKKLRPICEALLEKGLTAKIE